MRTPALILSLLFVFASSCEKWSVDGKLVHDMKFADELRSSPTTISLVTNSFIGSASLWRDFMPGPKQNENGSPLYSVVKAIEIDTAIIENGIILVRQYVIKDNEIWEPTFRTDASTQYYLSNSSSDGPRWGPNEIVDVVIELKDSSGIVHRLLIPSQEIFATQ